MGQAEIQQVLHGFNQTTVSYPAGQTVVDLVEQQVAKSPDQTAIVFEGQSWTYREVNEKANQLAHCLRNELPGFQLGDCIGVMMERNEWSAISMLAIMKMGGLYAPIDPNYPETRLAYILENSAARVVVTRGKEATENAQKLGATTIDVATEVEWANFSNQNLSLPIPAQAGSYLIYTSGSTGNPKGVVQTHQTLYNPQPLEIERWLYLGRSRFIYNIPLLVSICRFTKFTTLGERVVKFTFAQSPYVATSGH